MVCGLSRVGPFADGLLDEIVDERMIAGCDLGHVLFDRDDPEPGLGACDEDAVICPNPCSGRRQWRDDDAAGEVDGEDRETLTARSQRVGSCSTVMIRSQDSAHATKTP